MSNKKITDLTELTTPTTDDVFPVVDIATNTTQKVQLGNLPTTPAVTSALASKQATLVSGTNIKTINGTSVLGSGDIVTPYTPPSGVSGAIQFSNGSAFASDASNLFWDDANNLLGVGTNAPTSPLDILGGISNGGLKVRAGNTTSQNILDVANNAGTKGWVYRAGDGVLQFYGGTFQIESQSSNDNIVLASGAANGGVGINMTTPTARLHIKGSGSTSATTSLLVQNSAGNTALQVYDHLDTRVFGALAFNNGNTFIFNDSNTLQIAAINGATSDLHLNPNRQVNINNTGSYTAQASAILQTDSTTKGFLPPRMTTTQKNAIATPAAGLVVYDSTTNKLCCYNGSTWNDLF